MGSLCCCGKRDDKNDSSIGKEELIPEVIMINPKDTKPPSYLSESTLANSSYPEISLD
jgi:hypothetical protein